MMYGRILKLEEAKNDSLFLWGVRQVGKSALLETLFSEARYYDLLKSDEFERMFRRPSVLREEYPKVRTIIVSMDKYRCQLNDIEVIPAVEFLFDLWAGKIV
jgi:predicted AAA+ superfamily ATPase